MNTKKQYPNDKLQKSSMIFLQLGLILAMLFVYSILEAEFEQKKLADLVSEQTDAEIFIYPEAPPKIKIERPQQPKEIVEPQKPKEPSNDFKFIDDDTPVIETPVNTTEPIDDVTSSIGDLPNITEEENTEPELFILVENVPRYPGCEDLENKEAQICFTKKLTRFVNKKFNTGLAQDLGLQGKQRITVQFVIGKDGTITDIITRAAHKSLEKEAKRVIEKLPQMIPGMQRNRPVAVKYTLPIVFQVY